MIGLYSHQEEAIAKMKNGCILCGDVGTGKSRTAIGYFLYQVCDWSAGVFGSPRDLYIITTAKKRDSHDWDSELAAFCLSTNRKITPDISITVDSWNNISKYRKVNGAFFIFDEQRIVGYGSWVKSFLDISRKNQWILLTATPGDVWSDYIPVFIANGFYKNKTEFAREHIVYDRFAKYPKIDHYTNIKTLIKHRNDILVNMLYEKATVRNRIHYVVDYDKELYSIVAKDRWNPYDNEPIAETGKLCYLMRKVVNSDKSRIDKLADILGRTPKAIIFYNFTYELEMIREFLELNDIPYSEWNGEKHQEIHNGSTWVYLVQYSAGAEGWNCIETDTIIFYSLNYSYRTTVQAEGRIDRLNTKHKYLYYYYLESSAPIDRAIRKSLSNKRNFNEKTFLGI